MSIRASMVPSLVLAGLAATVASPHAGADPKAVAPSPHPPPPPTIAPPAKGALIAATTRRVTYAITKLYFGDTDAAGAVTYNAWRSYGYDVDGKVSTKDSTDLCKPRDNAPSKDVYPDGIGGIDNSFGHQLLPIVRGLDAAFAQKVNDQLAAGQFTILIDVPAVKATDASPLLARLYGGAPLGTRPKLDGTDAWPVAAWSLSRPADVSSAIVQFPSSYLNHDTWVSGSKGDLVMAIVLPGGQRLSLEIDDAVISMQLDPTHRHAAHGVISGILPSDRLAEELRQQAGRFDPTLCSGPTIDSIIAQVVQAGDVLHDGSQDPTKVCDGISIGLGFDAQLVTLGAIVPAPPPPPPSCPAH